MSVASDVLVEFHVHEAVVGQPVHRARLDLARLQSLQGLGLRHLVDDDLAFAQRMLGDPMPCLDQRRLDRTRGHRDSSGALEEAPDVHGVHGVVGALVDHLQNVTWPDQRGGHLESTGTPSVGQRHLPRPERHLVARNRDRFQDRPADHALGALVKIGEVEMRVADRRDIGVNDVHAASFPEGRARIFRTSSSSDWKST